MCGICAADRSEPRRHPVAPSPAQRRPPTLPGTPKPRCQCGVGMLNEQCGHSGNFGVTLHDRPRHPAREPDATPPWPMPGALLHRRSQICRPGVTATANRAPAGPSRGRLGGAVTDLSAASCSVRKGPGRPYCTRRQLHDAKARFP
jgi:hypothetical protein